MDQKQQKQVNEAAEKFAEAIKESYQAIAERSVAAQELNAQLTQESVNAYMDLLNPCSPSLSGARKRPKEAHEKKHRTNRLARGTLRAGSPGEKKHGTNRSTRGTRGAGSPDNGARPGGFV